MTPLLAAAADITLREILLCRSFWAILLGALSVWLLLPNRVRYGKGIGMALLILSAGLFASDWPLLGDWTAQAVFWLLATITLGAAVCTIASRSPVYSAIWFALSLLATGGLFFYQGAQFLGVATVVVYAGAIVVTFLFVIMLAQPEGHSDYDRITWGWFPKTFSVLAAATFVALLTFLLGNLRTAALATPIPAEAAELAKSDAARGGRNSNTQEPAGTEPSAAARRDREADASRSPNVSSRPKTPLTADDGVLSKDHMANLGRHLFGEHLISVELAGTLLLAALVGAVAIAIQGKPRLATRIEEALQ